jgi:hypothetical protein
MPSAFSFDYKIIRNSILIETDKGNIYEL